ncbi:MAG: hypothetical protein MUO43_04755 [Desulfobacterales bacterium]|nr:hypothetical protein [Desulfobacterales bacterium]
MLPNRFEKKLSKRFAIPAVLVAFLSFALIIPVISSAKVTGICSNCHTMHNSQGGADMADYGPSSGVNPCLTRGDCIGCHAYNSGSGTDNVENIDGSLVPQIWHEGTDLAAGNFKYISTDADANDNKGHNVADIDGEGTLTSGPPGDENSTGITIDLTCAGVKGCHGNRAVADETASVKGAHHAGVSGLCDTADKVTNSYRFLKGVKGYENMHATYKYQNYNSQYHNEYYSAQGTGTESTVSTPGGNTISGLCAECHGNFHGPQSGDIASGTASPWLRHPTDIVLTNSGEYTNHTTYSIVAPVARTSLGTINTGGTNNIVTPGTDVIMCLSCHGAHATDYYKLMRWDYKSWPGSGSNGCNICHTTKN